MFSNLQEPPLRVCSGSPFPPGKQGDIKNAFENFWGHHWWLQVTRVPGALILCQDCTRATQTDAVLVFKEQCDGWTVCVRFFGSCTNPHGMLGWPRGRPRSGAVGRGQRISQQAFYEPTLQCWVLIIWVMERRAALIYIDRSLSRGPEGRKTCLRLRRAASNLTHGRVGRSRE